jgi:transglutaminase-like putative cysteine protease
MRRYAKRERGWVARLIKWWGPRALLSWALLLVVMISITSGVTESAPGLDTSLVFTVTVVGVTFGWVLGLLPLRGGLTVVLSVVLGLEFLVLRVGRLGGDLWAIVEGMGRFVWEVVIWYWTEQAPTALPIATHYLELWQDVQTILVRTGGWLNAVVSGRGSYDVVGAAIAWGFVIWAYSVWAGFQVRRNHRTLLGVLPGSLLMSFAISYTGSNPYILLPVVGGALVLMAVNGQRARENRWDALAVDFSQGLWSDVVTTATGISLALVLVAAISPSISIRRIADWIDEVTNQEVEERTEAVAEGLGLEQKPATAAPRPLASARVTSLPQRHLIGSGPELSRRVVMVVETGELPPLPPEEMLDMSPPRHYWRSLTYDRYFGRGWATSSTETTAYEPGELATVFDADADHLRTLRQHVRLIGEGSNGIVYVDGRLVSVDEPFEVLWRPPDEIFAATAVEREYTADSVYVNPTQEQLREASTDYPEAVANRYLHIPDSTPERVLVLSRDLTATEPTPYDRALAIESYLREFPYTLDVPAPGESDDIADFFLFELQEGYCDYYATSMIVLARAAGIPARMVVGYVSGTYDAVNARYVVTEADAHAWPELYFPGYGWVEFEPTGGRAGISRRTEQDQSTWEPSSPPTPLVTTPPEEDRPILVVGQWLLAGVGGLALVIGVGTAIDVVILSLGSEQRMASRLRRRLSRHARRLRVDVLPGDTPLELSEALSMRLTRIAEAHQMIGPKMIAPGVDEVRAMASLYARVWYSLDGLEAGVGRRRAIWLWWRLRWRLWLARLWRRSGDQGGASTASAAGGRRVDRAAAGVPT